MTVPLRTDRLCKTFRRVDALRDLSLDVPEGAVFALVGPNGAGKTTAIKTLLNIHPPTTGRAEVLGVDSRALGAPELARIGYVSENQQLPGWMKVGYFLSYCKRILSRVARRRSGGARAPVRTASRPQTAPSLARHARESRAGIVPGLSSQADRARRTLRRPRRAGARAVDRKRPRSHPRSHRLPLFPRPHGDRKLRQPRRLFERGPAAVRRRNDRALRPLSRNRSNPRRARRATRRSAGHLAESRAIRRGSRIHRFAL